MIYLDNAATSFPKPEKVYFEMSRCIREYCANPGRSGHNMALESGKAVLKTRSLLAKLFNIHNPLQICFTKNATEALNMAIKGVLNENDHVITTCMEHNSVIRPLKSLERDKNVKISIIEGNDYGEIDINIVKKSIQKNTKLIVCTVSSNVNGVIMPIAEIGKLASEYGIIFLLDGSQGAGSLEIDVEKMNIDLLAFPGHKGLLGPQGTGGLYVKNGLKIKSFIEGGTGSNSEILIQPEYMPEFLESGTLNTPGIVGLGCGVEYILKNGVNNIHEKKSCFVKTLHEGIMEFKNAKIYSKKDIKSNSGIVAFNFDNIDSTEVSYILDKQYGIATRASLHCSPLAHSTLGTLKTGIVRLSVGYFNTDDDIDFTLKALKKIYENKE